VFINIKNTGKISSANIEISGITVMAGANNTGKSTVGKMLFCLFNSFYRIEQQIERERVSRIGNIIGSFYHETTNRLTARFDPFEFAETIINKKSENAKQKDLENDIRNLYFQADKNFEKHVSETLLSNVAEKTIQIINISNEDIFVAVLRRRLQAEFNMQINNINNSALRSEIRLRIKDREVKVSVIKNENIEITNSFSLNTEVIYMDDPFALDDFTSFRYSSINHRDHLKSKLLIDNEESTVKNAIDEIITSKRLEKVLVELNKVCKGELIRKTSSPRTTISYKEGDSETALDIKNISTGIKTFAIVKTLLLNGGLEENGILVLDEPEIHLHPEWQLVFAKLIVLLNKEFNMHILLNTHSPYFLDAIDVYSHFYGVFSKCKYYLAEDVDGLASMIDVTSNIELIYDKLSKPFQLLENERYHDDGFR